VYRWPAYSKDTVLFVTAFFGIPFITFGSEADNALCFAIRATSAARPEQPSHEGMIRGIAFSASVFALLVHTLSRRGGLLLINFLAIIKIGILLLIIALAIAYSAGAIGPTPSNAAEFQSNNLLVIGNISVANMTHDQMSSQNLGLQNSFRGASGNAFGYATALLDAIFAFSGFEQANYVLGEISQPHRKLPIGLGVSSGLVCVLYLAVNICYWAVVPQQMMLPQANGATPPTIAEAFFTLTLGFLDPNDPYLGKRIANVMTALSALGNIVVMMYSATRVKQEIAKEGLLPFPKFFAQNYDLSIGRLLGRAQKNSTFEKCFGWLLSSKWFAPTNFQEKTPAGAMTLQICVCFILLFSTWGLGANNAFSFLGGVGTYMINAWFGVMLSAGLLYLRFNKRENWNDKSNDINPTISILAASIYLIFNAFPVVTLWVKPPNSSSDSLSWFLIPTVSMIMLVCGSLWWLGFIVLTRRKDKRERTVLKVIKIPDYDEDPRGSGHYVQTHETTYIFRQGQDFAEYDMKEAGMSNGAARNRNGDFDRLDDFGAVGPGR